MPFSAPLVPHPALPPSAPLEISVRGDIAAPRMLTVEFGLAGDLTRIRMPATRAASATPVAAKRRDRLWEHTCFELFARADSTTKPYVEFNFSPSGDWAAYRFDDYRANQSVLDTRTPRILLQQQASTLSVTATVELAADWIRTDVPLCLNVTAVVEATDGSFSYWAPAHPAPQPDFHHPAAFTITLGAPDTH